MPSRYWHATLCHSIKQTYRFFDDLKVEHRILAYYRTVGSEQTERHGLDFDELVGAYKAVFHEWLASERATPVHPIKDYVRYAVQRIMGVDNDRYDPSTSERVFIVDVNGDVFNVSSYESEFCYGNLFHSPLREIAESEVRVRSIALSQERMQRFCYHAHILAIVPGFSWPMRRASSAKYWKQADAPYAPCSTTYLMCSSALISVTSFWKATKRTMTLLQRSSQP